MSYRILVEIGHEASIRTKRTPEGFTHDWEIFVRGCDADISHYVDKVVFNLHQTFTKPRRVVKEPPYKVKESGYAGFNLLIEIYLKNTEDPKKITFYYDLHLQPEGPAIYKVQKEKYVFHHPNEEFRQRLLKGGATLINTPSSHSESSREFPGVSDEQRSQLVDKPKLGGDMTKKPKIRTEETKLSNSFADLFGPPITKTAKVSPDPKMQIIKSSPKNISIKNEKNNAQQDKNSKSNKHSPQKDKSERSKEKDHSKKNKEDRRSKDKTKERDKSKEKNTKRDKSPPRRSSTSPRRSPKRESSPKKSSSPKRIASPSTKPKFEERNKYDESSCIKEKQTNDNAKPDKKVKKDKRDKVKDRDKDKREHKLHGKEENKNDLEQKETIKNVYKDTNNLKPTKDTTSKDKEQIKLKEKIKQSEHQQQQQQSSVSCRGEIKDSEKQKSVKQEISEKHKHKHKKKDREKSKKDEKERRHDKNKNDKISSDIQQINTSKTIVSNESSKILPTVNNEIEKENHQNKNNSTQAQNIETFTSTRDEIPKIAQDKLSTNPLNTLIAELSENESSDSSNHSIKNNTDIRIRNKINSKSTTNVGVVDSTPPPLLPPPPPPPPVEIQKEFTPSSIVTPVLAPPPIEQNDKKSEDRVEKTKKSKKHRDKHKSNKSPDKDTDRKRKRKSSSKIDDVDTSSDKIINISNDEHQPRPTKQIKGERKISEEEKIEQNTADYMGILKDLQHKIMTLQDNSELQRVVQLIAETGQYEITRQTFDFDLCALDRKTVDRLQEFFKAT